MAVLDSFSASVPCQQGTRTARGDERNCNIVCKRIPQSRANHSVLTQRDGRVIGARIKCEKCYRNFRSGRPMGGIGHVGRSRRLRGNPSVAVRKRRRYSL